VTYYVWNRKTQRLALQFAFRDELAARRPWRQRKPYHYRREGLDLSGLLDACPKGLPGQELPLIRANRLASLGAGFFRLYTYAQSCPTAATRCCSANFRFPPVSSRQKFLNAERQMGGRKMPDDLYLVA